MSNIIDFTQEKDKKEIDAQYRMVMPDGSKWYKFFAEYDYQSNAGGGLPESILQALDSAGAQFHSGKFEITFWAQSMEDAENRVKSMREGLALGGQLYNEV